MTIKRKTSRRAPTKADYETLAGFRFQLRRFLEFSRAAAKRTGLTPQQHQALLAIKGFPGRDAVTVGELAERLFTRHHSAVELIDRLAQMGLVRRDVDPADRRRVLVSLTPRAETLLGRLSAVHLEELRRVGPALMAELQRLNRR